MATLGERPAADRSGLRRATGDGLSPGFGDSGPGGPGPDMVLPSAETLREPQPRSDRRERQLLSGLSRTATRSIATSRPDIITSRQRASAGTSIRTRMLTL